MHIDFKSKDRKKEKNYSSLKKKIFLVFIRIFLSVRV